MSTQLINTTRDPTILTSKSYFLLKYSVKVFSSVESSMYAHHIKIGEELEKRNAKHQNLQRQHFMNTRYSQGRALTGAQLNDRFYTIPESDLEKLSPTHARQPFKGDLRHTR